MTNNIVGPEPQKAVKKHIIRIRDYMVLPYTLSNQ